jgi:hypothetical protein
MTYEKNNNLDAMNKAINLLNLTNESHYIRQVVQLAKMYGVDKAYSLAEEQAEAFLKEIGKTTQSRINLSKKITELNKLTK